MKSAFITSLLTAAIAAVVAFSANAVAAPLADLSAGQTGRIEFQSTTPDSRFAVIRGRLGSPITVFGDLLMPTQKVDGKVPAVVFSHGSEGVSSLAPASAMPKGTTTTAADSSAAV